ncbi:hypothetical protein [Desulfarculus baarsii]
MNRSVAKTEAIHAEGLRILASILEAFLPDVYGQRMGFVLMVTPFGEGTKRADYISNIDRETIVGVLREKARRFEENEDFQPAAGAA